MALTRQTWQRVADSKWSKTDSFKKLDRAVKEYLANGDKSHRDELQLRWNGWKLTLANKTGAKTYQTSDRYESGGALDDIEAMFQIPAITGFPSIKSSAERSLAKLIRQRDLQSDERGREYMSVNGSWQPKIFSQQEVGSCTCACATTFVSKLLGKSLREDVFKSEFDRQVGGHHDFSMTGTLFPDIEKTLLVFGADVQYLPMADTKSLLNKLREATNEIPIMFGVKWQGEGAHAVMCIGEGQVHFSNSQHPFQGFLIEDPWALHEEVGMKTNGNYWVKERASGNWTQGWAEPSFGCIVGKPSRQLNRLNYSNYRRGVQVM